jgi:hypothetical protein
MAETFRLASEPQSHAQIEYRFLLSFLSYFILLFKEPQGAEKLPTIITRYLHIRVENW